MWYPLNFIQIEIKQPHHTSLVCCHHLVVSITYLHDSKMFDLACTVESCQNLTWGQIPGFDKAVPGTCDKILIIGSNIKPHDSMSMTMEVPEDVKLKNEIFQTVYSPIDWFIATFILVLDWSVTLSLDLLLETFLDHDHMTISGIQPWPRMSYCPSFTSHCLTGVVPETRNRKFQKKKTREHICSLQAKSSHKSMDTKGASLRLSFTPDEKNWRWRSLYMPFFVFWGPSGSNKGERIS